MVLLSGEGGADSWWPVSAWIEPSGGGGPPPVDGECGFWVSWSALDAPGAQSGLPVALHEQERDHDGHDGQQRAGDDQVVDRLPADRARLRAPFEEADRE